MRDIDSLVELFQKYGYRKDDLSTESCLIFTLSTGMYPAAEILPVPGKITSDEILQIKQSYYEAGYAVRTLNLTDLESIENYLFSGFFHVKAANARLQKKYDEYVARVMKPYLDSSTSNEKLKYQYINIKYEKEFNFESSSNTALLTDALVDELKDEGAKLIIVEAAAGFGKTSTAFEVLHRYSLENEGSRPLFMELSKDRQAATFRYLLLSQIERDFDVLLKNDIVIYNIKQGKIPLIIDGFDELLSKDLDNGSNEASFTDVETMLSTIAELLTGNTKVLLTTRKTAIFSGDSFYDWYNNQSDKGFNFNISRYQLESPIIRDWLPAEKFRLLDKSIDDINNPVLLGYLRYVDFNTFKTINTPTKLIQSYFDFLLKREIDRQDLPFNTEEQLKIFRRLAAYFACFEITADNRTDIKNAFLELAPQLIQSKTSAAKDESTITNALTNHALLDRKDNGKIGFISDYILGTLLMHSIIYDEDQDSKDLHENISYTFLEKAISAGELYDIKTKKGFWKKLFKKCKMNNALKFMADSKLNLVISHSFEHETFANKAISNVTFGIGTAPIRYCNFTNMRFMHCHFNFGNIQNCCFINCDFEECTHEGDLSSCDFYNCQGLASHDNYEDAIGVVADDRIQILSMYLQVDGRTRRMRLISKLIEAFCGDKKFKKVYASLVKDGYIFTNGDKSFITNEGITYYQNHKLYE